MSELESADHLSSQTRNLSTIDKSDLLTVRSVPIEEPPLAASSTFEDLTSKTESEVGGISLIPGGLSEKDEQKLKLLDQARRYREVQVIQ